MCHHFYGGAPKSASVQCTTLQAELKMSVRDSCDIEITSLIFYIIVIFKRKHFSPTVILEEVGTTKKCLCFDYAKFIWID